MIFACTLPNRCPVKKNTQRIVGFGISKRAIYSAQFLRWEFDAVMNMRQAYRGDPIIEPIKLVIRFYFKDRQAEADLSNLIHSVDDTLKKAGVIKDDKIICEIVTQKFFGDEPRVEIEIWKMEEEK